MEPRLARNYARLRRVLLRLPRVTTGERFGGEAFFFGKRFFCHFHKGKGFLFLETFVWNKFGEVAKSVPGVILHPKYGGYGWVRLKVSSSPDLRKARRLIEMSYEYMIRIKRISLPKGEHTERLLSSARDKFPAVHFTVRESLKRTQVIMEAKWSKGPVLPSELLNQATIFLRQS